MKILKRERINLTKLMVYLRALPEDYGNFGMYAFYKTDKLTTFKSNSPIKIIHTCGTSACAVGHAPNAGVPIPKDSGSWIDYSYQTLCNKDETLFGGETSPWDYLFSSEWGKYDDTAKGAADRIEYYLEIGPDELVEECFPWLLD